MVQRPLIDIGLIAAGRLSSPEQRLIADSARSVQRWLTTRFPDFEFRVVQHRRRDLGEFAREESSALLQQAAEERDHHHWDLALLVTADELIPHYRPYALAALSRPLDAAVVSVARLTPGRLPRQVPTSPDAAPTRDDPPDTARHTDGDEGGDAVVTMDRLSTLLLHAIGHLAGLDERQPRERLLYRPADATELDNMADLSEAERTALTHALANIADARLEESASPLSSRWRFFLHASWINRQRIGEAVIAARPWQFPLHLSRLTTAAVSAIAILLMTAESWDLGLAQSWTRVSALAILVLILTSVFVLTRQHLLLIRNHALREQIVVTQVSATLVVVSGLAVTWVSIWLLALCAAGVLFDTALIQSWAASTVIGASAAGLPAYLKMSTFCASIGLLIGSLGASFEDQHHFQHVIFVDAEV